MARRAEPTAGRSAHTRTTGLRTRGCVRAGSRGRPPAEPTAGGRAGHGAAWTAAQGNEDRNVPAVMGRRVMVRAAGRGGGAGRVGISSEIPAASKILALLLLLRREPVLLLGELVASRLRTAGTAVEHQRRGDEHQADFFAKAVHTEFRGDGEKGLRSASGPLWTGESIPGARSPLAPGQRQAFAEPNSDTDFRVDLTAPHGPQRRRCPATVPRPRWPLPGSCPSVPSARRSAA